MLRGIRNVLAGLTLFFVVALSAVNVRAQLSGQVLLDSLIKASAIAKEDTLKVQVFGKIAILYKDINIDSLFSYAKKQYDLAVKLNYKRGICGAYGRMGLYYRYNGKYDEALKYQNLALEIQKDLQFGNGVAISYENIGLIYCDIGNYSEALKYIRQSFEIAKSIDDKKIMADDLVCIGNIYLKEGIYAESIKYYFDALKINELRKYKEGIAICYNNIGNVYILNNDLEQGLKNIELALKQNEEIGDKVGMVDCHYNLGDIYSRYGKDSLAKFHFQTGLKLAKESGKLEKILDIYMLIGALYDKENIFDNAIRNYDTAKNIALSIQDKLDISAIDASIGNIFLRMKQLSKSRDFNKEALSTAQKIGYLDGIKSADSNLSAVYELTGSYKDALESYRDFIRIRDSMFNKENTKKLVQTQMQYDFDKKEAIEKKEEEKKEALAEEKIRKQKQLKFIFIGGFGVVLVFSMVVFRQRNRISKEKKRSEDLLLNILPEEVAHELKEKGSAEAKHFDNVTVLFTDFKGFTKLAEKMTPQQLVAELDTCFRGFDAIIQKYNLEKIKTIGDAYMAVSGLPTPNADHARLMVQAGIEIRDFIVARKEERGELGFDVRVGIHSGDVVAGIVGFKKFAYDIWGDTVNTASRMESSGEPGKVNISGTTYELVKDKFEFYYRGKLAAKNKGEMDMYFVENKA